MKLEQAIANIEQVILIRCEPLGIALSEVDPSIINGFAKISLTTDITSNDLNEVLNFAMYLILRGRENLTELQTKFVREYEASE